MKLSDDAKVDMVDLIKDAIKRELRRQEDANPHSTDLWTGDEIDPNLIQIDGHVDLGELSKSIVTAVFA